MFADLRETLVAFHREDSGPDLIEYALIGATAGLSTVATALDDAFSSMGEKLKSYAK